MSSEITRRLYYLAVYLVIALAVWGSYRSATSTPAERYSTFGPRFWAQSVDVCVLWPVGFIAAILLTSDIPRGLAAVVIVVQSLAWLMYTVVMHARYGQTVGKMVTKVRVVDNRTEGSISWRQAWLREGIPLLMSLGWLVWEVVHILDGSWTFGASGDRASMTDSGTFWLLTWLPMLWFAAEVVTMLTNKKRRALHDFIAGTVVVRTNTVVDEASEEAGADGDSAIGGLSRRTEGRGSGIGQWDSVEAIWSAFLEAYPDIAGPDTAYSTWHFGSKKTDADESAQHVLSGRKRATASLLWSYEAKGQQLPQVGDLSVVTDWAGHAVCVIRTTSVEVIALDAVTEEHAAAEGEGDGSLAHWRKTHTAAFAKDLWRIERGPEPDMPVVFEHFEVVYGA